jgi:alpha-1,3-rhamnosyl/mannosyltransferase
VTAIGVNLLWCRPGQVGGSEEYLTRQLTGLAGLPEADGFDVSLLALPSYATAHPDLAQAYRVLPAPVRGGRLGLRVAAEYTWMNAKTRERHFAFVHHGGGTMPRLRAAPGVLTIHDLQYLAYPQFFRLGKLTWLRSVVPPSVRRATVVTVPSTFVKDSVVSSFDYPPSRVIVVPHGIPKTPAPASDDTLARYGLPGRYIAYPAITHPHKDHVVLLRAVAALGSDADDVKVLLLGGRGLADSDVTAEISALGLESRIVRPGRVPDADRDALVAGATVLAFPSRYEGFGAPVLEAMALGTPVIAADATALPEVVGDAGILVAPVDPTAWRDALAALLADEIEQARLRQAGPARAAQFSLETSARSLLSAYRLALA